MITLGIIGIVAALTIPSIIAKYQTQQYKTAYKKAYSELSQVVLENVALNNFPYRIKKYDRNASYSEWILIKEKFKVIKDCSSDNAFDCWVDADKVCSGGCTGMPDGQGGGPWIESYAFIDASGRSWIQYGKAENLYFVDTNGKKGPNLFGKDRFMFTFFDTSNQRIKSGLPKKVLPYQLEDILIKDTWCSTPPCYYYSWIFD